MAISRNAGVGSPQGAPADPPKSVPSQEAPRLPRADRAKDQKVGSVWAASGTASVGVVTRPAGQTQPLDAATVQSQLGKDVVSFELLEKEQTLRFRRSGDTEDRLAFIAVGSRLLEMEPPHFIATPDLLHLLRDAGKLQPAAINLNNDGLITEDEIWDYFSKVVQEQREVFGRIKRELERLHPELTQYLADGDVVGPGRLPGMKFEPGVGDVRELVQADLKAVADLLGIPEQDLTDTERFNVAVGAFARLNVGYDDLREAAKIAPENPRLTLLNRQAVVLGRNRPDGAFTPLQVLSDARVPALCLEQSLLFAMVAREAGLTANITGINYAEAPKGTKRKEMTAFATHVTVAVHVDGEVRTVEPQWAREVAEKAVPKKQPNLQTTSPADALRLGSAVQQQWQAVYRGPHMLKSMVHADLGPTREFNDKEALGAGFANSALFNLQRAMHDPLLSQQQKRELIERSGKELEVARRMCPSFIDIPTNQLLHGLALAEVEPNRRQEQLLHTAALADELLAKGNWKPHERAWMLCMKLEALALAKGDVSETVGAIKAIRDDIGFVYEPVVANPQLLRPLIEPAHSVRMQRRLGG